ncbi:MAG: ABC transporter permease [Firmicutes bacterium]|nr:ABC transporter permease [Bacillota bacterium]
MSVRLATKAIEEFGHHKRTLLAPILRLATLLALCLILTLLSENFLTWNNIINVLRQSTMLVVIGLGLTAVVLTAGIDLSVGGVLALVGCLTAQLLRSGVPIPLAMLIGIGVGAILGYFNGILVGIIGLPPFVATYGTKWIAEGLALILMQGQIIFGLPKAFRWIGAGYIWIIPAPIIITAVLALIFHILLSKTTIGYDIYALGTNREAAFYSGINVRAVSLLVYTLSGITAAIAGLLMTARLDAAEVGMGEPFLMQGMASVVMGGTSLMGGVGSIGGTIIGALILTLVVNGLNLLGISSLVHNIVTGGVILLAVFGDSVLRKYSE